MRSRSGGAQPGFRFVPRVADLRYAIRFLWTHKAFTAAAVLTLAIGLGANTALYGMLNATLRPLALPDPEQLVVIAAEPKGDETGGFQFAFSTEQLKDLQERAEAFTDVVGFMPRIGGVVDRRQGGAVLVRRRERQLLQRDSAFARHSAHCSRASPARRSHVVLGHSFWMKHFGGDPNVIGKPIRMDGAPAVVTGVVERSFRGTVTAVEMDGYIAIEDYGVLNPDASAGCIGTARRGRCKSSRGSGPA